MKPSVLPILSLPLLLLGLAAPAQTIYRCGNSYSAQPCPDGQTIQAADPRSAEQRQAHEAQVRHEKRTAERLEQERLREEAAAARAAQHARGVRVVHHDQRAVALGHRAELGQGRYVSVHAEHAIGDQEH